MNNAGAMKDFRDCAISKFKLLLEMVRSFCCGLLGKANDSNPEQVAAVKDAVLRAKDRMSPKVTFALVVILAVLGVLFLWKAVFWFVVLFATFVVVSTLMAKSRKPMSDKVERSALVSVPVLALVIGLAGLFGAGGGQGFERVAGSFVGAFCTNEQCTPGNAYSHVKSPFVKVISVVDDGVIVSYVSGAGDIFSNAAAEYMENLNAITGGSFDKILHVSTQDAGYVDGAQLEDGIYVREGTYSYVNALGVSCTIESYFKLEDESEIERFNKIKAEMAAADKAERMRKAEEARKKEAEEAAKRAAEEKAAHDARVKRYEELFTDEVLDDLLSAMKFCVQNSIKEKCVGLSCPVLTQAVDLARNKKWDDFWMFTRNNFSCGPLDSPATGLENIKKGNGVHQFAASFELKDGLVLGREEFLGKMEFESPAIKRTPEEMAMIYVFCVHLGGDGVSFYCQRNEFKLFKKRYFVATRQVLKNFWSEHRDLISRCDQEEIERALQEYLKAN